MSDDGAAAPPLPPLAQIPAHVAAVSDYETLARQRLSAQAWAYFSGGAADEITLRRNVDAFRQLPLCQRVLPGLEGGTTRLDLFGYSLDYPILLAPVAYHRLAHAEGEAATVMAACAMRAGLVVSTESSVPLEDIARASTTLLWFQLYMQRDRACTRDLVERAERAGYRALVVTADATVSGPRNGEQRSGFRLPAGLGAVNLRDYPSAPAAVARAGESPIFGSGFLDGAPDWQALTWLRSQTALPILLKGVMTPADARLAIDHGADGIIVSNHGGRTLDTQPATIEVLPEIAAAVGGRVPLLLDGGIRRGSDVLKALALGARAVLIGRPYIHALAAAGAIGVAHVLHLLRTELEMAMVQTGCRTLAGITPAVFWRRPAR